MSDSFRSIPFFKTRFFQLNPMRESMKSEPRLEMKFNWSLKLMDRTVPLQIRRLIINILQMTILPRSTNGIEQLRPMPLIHERNSWGIMSLYLKSPKLLSMKIESPQLPTTVKFMIPLNRRIETFPCSHGPNNMAKFVDVATKVECIHTTTNEFITFDGVRYEYTFPTESCEQTLVRTINNVSVTAQAKGNMKILRFRMGDSVLVEVIPETPTGLPRVMVRFQF